jgi:secondary thiamine-phosphate synthase enzyme
MPGRSTLDITDEVNAVVRAGHVATGVAHVFIRHTSASLMICENIDPTVRADVERWLAQAVRDGDAMFKHNMEGPDDMSGHIRSILTGMDLSLPITDGALNLGTWQGIYLYEHRSAPRTREVVVTLLTAADGRNPKTDSVAGG